MAEAFASSSTWPGPVRPPTANPPAVAVRTLGCKVNQAESEAIAAGLLGFGVGLVPEASADVVVVNTCTVTAEADRKVRKLVRHALDLPKKPLVVVTGCAAAVDALALRALGERVVVEARKENVAARAAALGERHVAGGVSAASGAPATAAGGVTHTRRLLQVEDGCDAGCAYCIVPRARGNPRSVPLQDVVRAAERTVAEGGREIVVTGINVGRYRDAAGEGLPGLIRAIAGTGVARLRLSSIEPLDLTDALLAAMRETPAFCGHLHVPLQSGSDRVLAAMRRGYTVADFADRIVAAREAVPGLAATTDVMAGFPGEREADFEATLVACERLAFAKLHVFRYSRRSGTLAAGMAGQVPPGVAAQRARILRESGEEARAAWVDARLGSVAEVLVERVFDRGGVRWIAGTARDYLKVSAPHATARAGELARLVLVGRGGQEAIGRPAAKDS